MGPKRHAQLNNIGPGLDHGVGVLGRADAARRLHPHPVADDPAHEGHVLRGRATRGEARRGLEEVGAERHDGLGLVQRVLGRGVDPKYSLGCRTECLGPEGFPAENLRSEGAHHLVAAARAHGDQHVGEAFARLRLSLPGRVELLLGGIGRLEQDRRQVVATGRRRGGDRSAVRVAKLGVVGQREPDRGETDEEQDAGDRQAGGEQHVAQDLQSASGEDPDTEQQAEGVQDADDVHRLAEPEQPARELVDELEGDPIDRRALAGARPCTRIPVSSPEAGSRAAGRPRAIPQGSRPACAAAPAAPTAGPWSSS